MLTRTLKKLENNHLLKRKAYTEIPPSVEYSLTNPGKSLMPLIEKMIEWCHEHLFVYDAIGVIVTLFAILPEGFTFFLTLALTLTLSY